MARALFALVVIALALCRASAFVTPAARLPVRSRPAGDAALKMAEVAVEFTQSAKKVNVAVGTPLSQLCAKNGIKVKYNCKAGNCATCEINMDGRYIKACQGKVPSSRRVIKIRK